MAPQSPPICSNRMSTFQSTPSFQSRTGGTQTLERSSNLSEIAPSWVVVVFNNDINTLEEVAKILQKATGCSLEHADEETWEIHNLGKSVVHHSSKMECLQVAEIIRTIGIDVQVVSE